MSIKNFFKRFVPAPMGYVDARTAMILDAVKKCEDERKKQNELLNSILESINDEASYNQKMFVEVLDNIEKNNLCEFKGVMHDELSSVLNERTSSLIGNMEKISGDYNKTLDDIAGLLNGLREINEAGVSKIVREITVSKHVSEEAVWGHVFNSAIAECKWFKNRNLCPGRAAMAYPSLYALFRILDDYKPKNILELGLGQSTHLISQYVLSDENVHHYIVENDRSWADFFCSTHELSPKTEMCIFDLEMIKYKEAEEIRTYKGFSEKFSGEKFDFICVDAPLGVDMKIYSRIDILSILPDCLSDSFAIMVDDTNRSGEKKTVEEIERILTEANIEYAKGTYVSQKYVTVIASADNKFLCTL